MSKIYAVGDIHGCYDKLLTLMDRMQVDPERDLLVFLGDYVDRGPQSYEVVEYLIELKRQVPNVIFLKGNHEEMLLNYLEGGDKIAYMINGGNQTLESYIARGYPKGGEMLPPEHLTFLTSLLLYYQTEDYIFVHAGLKPGVPLHRQTALDMLWIRGEFINSDYDFGKPVVFGHTPFLAPLVDSNKIGVDTGAVYGDQLSCVVLPEVEFISV
jgi:serine/threonine protein phosphatase 1